MKTKSCKINPRKVKRVTNRQKQLTNSSTLKEAKIEMYIVSKVFECFINFFSIACLQPALPNRNISNNYLCSVQLNGTINESYLQECKLNFEPKQLSVFVFILNHILIFFSLSGPNSFIIKIPLEKNQQFSNKYKTCQLLYVQFSTVQF